MADVAILVVDINDGCKPQTIESIRILKATKTPFVVAANKVDRIHRWESVRGRPMALALREQTTEALGHFDQKYWKLVGSFAEHGFNLERYDRIKDFTKEIALVPISARQGEGIQDLLAVVIGMAERYLDDQLTDIEGAGEGTVLEMKEERGLGKTLDVILYRGSVKKGDEIVLVTDVRASRHVRDARCWESLGRYRDCSRCQWTEDQCSRYRWRSGWHYHACCLN
ncbi:MAG: hypothetical protein CXT64_06670 [Methanobacteriota archaeon]|nr:MAG: hypothetical protein CXT64_06670 [Euryarchaeota archaeon]